MIHLVRSNSSKNKAKWEATSKVGLRAQRVPMRWLLRAALGTLPTKDKNLKFAFNFFCLRNSTCPTISIYFLSNGSGHQNCTCLLPKGVFQNSKTFHCCLFELVVLSDPLDIKSCELLSIWLGSKDGRTWPQGCKRFSLSNQKPKHTTGGSRRSAWQGVGAGKGTNVRQQNSAPREQSFLALSKSVADRSPELFPRSTK